MRLRDVSTDAVDACVRMRCDPVRCDPVMTADVGGSRPREERAAEVRRDAEQAAADPARVR